MNLGGGHKHSGHTIASIYFLKIKLILHPTIPQLLISIANLLHLYYTGCVLLYLSFWETLPIQRYVGSWIFIG